MYVREHHHDTLPKNSDTHQHNTRNRANLHMTATKLKITDKAPVHAGKMLFNYLPNDIKSVTNLNMFKRKLRNYLVEKCLYSVDSFKK